jgi:predicted glycoside hydrolase/deacetylase ChbG (UPF0249 family)
MASAARELQTRGGSDDSGMFRRVVLHADDFGMNEQVNAGILRGFTHGLLTSTSILANAPGCAAALAGWKDLETRFANDDLPSLIFRRHLADSLNRFDLGIHLNLTQGRPLRQGKFPPHLLDQNGQFPGVFMLAARLLTASQKYRRAIEAELCAQIEVLVDRGISPTHMNAHQYVDLLPTVSAIIPGLMRRYAIPVVRTPWETHLTQTTLIRRLEPANWCLAQVKRLLAFHHLVQMQRSRASHPAAYFGTSHAGQIDLDLMRIFVAAAGPGITEIGMHPGTGKPAPTTADVDDGWFDPLAAARGRELALLSSPELARLLESHRVRLVRLSDLTGRGIACAAA